MNNPANDFSDIKSEQSEQSPERSAARDAFQNEATDIRLTQASARVQEPRPPVLRPNPSLSPLPPMTIHGDGSISVGRIRSNPVER
jgi:hypothetical protein